MLKDTLLRRLQYTRGRTLAVASAMPTDRFEFIPWEGSTNFSEHLRHIASSERTLVGALRNGTWDWDQGIDKSGYPDPATVGALLQETALEMKSLLADWSEDDLLRSMQVPWDKGEWNPARVIIEWIAHSVTISVNSICICAYAVWSLPHTSRCPQ